MVSTKICSLEMDCLLIQPRNVGEVYLGDILLEIYLVGTIVFYAKDCRKELRCKEITALSSVSV